jgi:lipoyl(octanoyl) transferase
LQFLRQYCRRKESVYMQPKVTFSIVKNKNYQEVWDIQTAFHKELIEKKLQNRYLPASDQKILYQDHRLIFCEHHHVYTLGKSGSMDHLLLSDVEIKNENIEFFKINRGGDITYHGPGQITGYLIMDLEEFTTDVHLFVRNIEEAIIRYISSWGLEGIRLPKYTGVWLPPDKTSEKYRKICAIGVHLSRWVSMHGFAFNLNTDLSYYDKIIPCGIIDEDKTVTSLSAETGQILDWDTVAKDLSLVFSEVFSFKF